MNKHLYLCHPLVLSSPILPCVSPFLIGYLHAAEKEKLPGVTANSLLRPRRQVSLVTPMERNYGIVLSIRHVPFHNRQVPVGLQTPLSKIFITCTFRKTLGPHTHIRDSMGNQSAEFVARFHSLRTQSDRRAFHRRIQKNYSNLRNYF